jgi:hypothetical protein
MEGGHRGKAELCVICYVVLLGGSMILAPYIVRCILCTVTYAHGATKVGFPMMDRLHLL